MGRVGNLILPGSGHPIVERGRMPLPHTEDFDAEAVAALRGLQASRSSVRVEFADNIYLCLDNLEVCRSLAYLTETSSQGAFIEFVEAAQEWPQGTRKPRTRPGQVVVRWVPGHTGVPGNEAADVEAGAATATTTEALEAGEDAGAPAAVACTKRRLKERVTRACQAFWAGEVPQAYQVLGASFKKKLSEMGLSGFALGVLIANRNRHGDFAAYVTALRQSTATQHSGRPRYAPQHLERHGRGYLRAVC